jgi:hypothetical protein
MWICCGALSLAGTASGQTNAGSNQPGPAGITNSPAQSNNAPNDLQWKGAADLDPKTFGDQWAAFSNSLSANLALLTNEMEELRSAKGGPAKNQTAPASIPGALWALALANFVLGAGVLGISAVLLRERKSVVTQVRSVVAGQIPAMAKTLADQVQPELDAAIRQGQELAGAMQQAAKRNQEFLDSMKAKHEQYFDSFLETAESASRTAIETLSAESRAMLGQLQGRAAEDFQKLFQGARIAWQADLGLELQKVKDNWNSMVKDSQKLWQSQLDGEIAAIKQTWLRQLDEHQKQWQSSLNVFMETQPEFWQKRLDQAAAKASAAWNSQLEALEAKNAGLWHAIEQALAEAQSRLARLNEEIGGAFQRLKVRDDAMTALVWPPFFQEGGGLAVWKQKIEDRLAQHDPGAFDLFLALGRFNNTAREAGDTRRLDEVLHGVGVEAYRFWKSLGAAQLDAALEWRSGFQGYLDTSGIPIDIILALERDRFDTNTMLSVDVGSASRMYVKEALSWVVRDKSSDPPKVLCHARVITC